MKEELTKTIKDIQNKLNLIEDISLLKDEYNELYHNLKSLEVRCREVIKSEIKIDKMSKET